MDFFDTADMFEEHLLLLIHLIPIQYLYVSVGQQYPDAVQAEQKQAAFGAGKTIINSKIYRYYLIH